MMNSVELSNETIPSQDHSECVKCALSGLTLDTQQHSQLIASLDRVDAEYIEVCLAVVRCNDYPARE